MAENKYADRSVTLWRNNRKRPDSRDPDYTGSGKVFGQEVEVAGYINECGPNSKAPGTKFLKLIFSVPRQYHAQAQQPQQQPQQQSQQQAPVAGPVTVPSSVVNDDIPF